MFIRNSRVIKLNGKSFASKSVLTFLFTNQGKRQTLHCENWWVLFYPPFCGGMPDSSHIFLSLIKVNGEHLTVKIDGLCFTLCFAEGCLIVFVLFLTLIKVKHIHIAVKNDSDAKNTCRKLRIEPKRLQTQDQKIERNTLT